MSCQFFSHVHKIWSYLFGHLDLVKWVFLMFIINLYAFTALWNWIYWQNFHQKCQLQRCLWLLYTVKLFSQHVTLQKSSYSECLQHGGDGTVGLNMAPWAFSLLPEPTFCSQIFWDIIVFVWSWNGANKSKGLCKRTIGTRNEDFGRSNLLILKLPI